MSMQIVSLSEEVTQRVADVEFAEAWYLRPQNVDYPPGKIYLPSCLDVVDFRVV